MPGGRILLLDPHALPPSCSRDTWTRRIVAEPSTRILDDDTLRGIVPECRGGVVGAAATP